MSIVYEVNLLVDAAVAEDYLDWLRPHMAEVLASDGFLDATLFEVESDGAASRGYSVRYTVRDRAALEAYFSGPAAALREDGQRRFGGRFQADRRIMRAI